MGLLPDLDLAAARLNLGVAVGVLDQRDLFVKLDKPIAAFALGNRRIAPWSRMAVPPVSQQKPAQELEPTEKAPSK